MSMISTSGAMRFITPWQVPTKSSCTPKSVRNVMNRATPRRSLRGRQRPASSPPPRRRVPLPAPPPLSAVRSRSREAASRAEPRPARPRQNRAPRARPREPSASARSSGRPHGSRQGDARRAASAHPPRRRRAPGPRVAETERGGDVGGTLAAPPLDPASILGRHERCELAAVVVGGNRSETPPADRRNAGPLCLHPASGLAVIRGFNEPLLTRSHLKRKCTLAGFRHHHVGLEAETDLVGETETIEAARRQHDRVEPAFPALAQSRIDVAAQGLDRKA